MGQQVNNHNTAYAIGDFINRHYSTLVTLIDTGVVAALYAHHGKLHCSLYLAHAVHPECIALLSILCQSFTAENQ